MFRHLCIVGIGLILLAWVSVTLADGQAHPATDYFRNYAFSDARLNPGGSLVLALNRTDKDHQYVSLIDLASQTSIDLVVTGGEAEYFSNLQWISDDTAIFTDHLGLTEYRLLSVQWQGMKDGKPQYHVNTWPPGVFFVDPLSMKNDEVLLGRWEDYSYHIYKIDINGDPRRLDRLLPATVLDVGVSRYLIDHNGVVRLKGNTDKDGVQHFSWLQDDGKTWKEFKQVDKEHVFNPVFLSGNGKRFLVFSNLGRDTIGFFEYDPITNQFTRTLLAEDDSDVTDYYYDWGTRQVTAALWFPGGIVHYEILDPRAAKLAPALQNAFPGQAVVPTDISRDGHEIVVYTYSSTNPGVYYAVDVKAGKAELLGEHAPWFDGVNLAPVHVGSVKTQDGFSISYLLTLPASGSKPYPMVVIPHGGPIGIFDADGYDDEAQFLASRGYAVLKVNYRGSGGNGTKFENAGKQQWGRKIEDDIEESVETVLKNNPIDADRICIFGASYGGYSALMSVIRDPKLYKCAATYAGVTDLPLLYDSSTVQFSRRAREEMADIIGDPTTDAEQLRAVSPVYLVDMVSRPIFLAQGGLDRRVDEEQAYRFKLAMDTLKKPLEFKFYPDEIHGFENKEDEVDFYTRLLDFLDRNIGSKRVMKKAASSSSH